MFNTDDKRSRAKLRVSTVTLALACVSCVGPFTEMFEQSYPNVEAARAVDAVGGNAWIPEILPDDATSIREVHDIDSNLTWGCFQTQSFDVARKLLSDLGAEKTYGRVSLGPSEIFRDFSWWPDSMGITAVEVWEFFEPPHMPLLDGYYVRVGIDASSKIVCFHRDLP